MNNMILLFDEYLIKAVTMTETILNEYRDGEKLEYFTQNRERLMSIIDQISQQLNWNEVEDETKEDFNKKINYIKNLDVKLLTCLQEYQEEVRKEIEQTFKQRENIRGYNLSDVK